MNFTLEGISTFLIYLVLGTLIYIILNILEILKNSDLLTERKQKNPIDDLPPGLRPPQLIRMTATLEDYKNEKNTNNVPTSIEEWTRVNNTIPVPPKITHRTRNKSF